MGSAKEGLADASAPPRKTKAPPQWHTHKKWNKLKTFYLLLRIHNSALQYNVTGLAGALFELTAFYLKNIGSLCQEGLSPTKVFTSHT